MSSIDWRTVFMLLPRRRFTAAELARAVPGPVGATLKAAVALNLALLLLMFVVVFVKRGFHPLALFLAGFVLTVVGVGMAAWRNPSGTVARAAYWGVPIAAGLVVGGLTAREAIERNTAAVMVQMVAFGVLGTWFTIVHRQQYIELRLRELDERERAVEMAQRLASAQLAPHFLFNTLASVQHWVQTRDERAAPLLQSLTGYLRATLPMFSRALHAAADEIELTRRCLEIMQARLGARLRFSIDVQPALNAVPLPLPPGLLLTLAENAVEHGIDPRVDGGTLSIEAHTEGEHAVFVVQDDGPGLPPQHCDGTGISNISERLALTHGQRASLAFTSAAQGGCVATVRIPLHK